MARRNILLDDFTIGFKTKYNSHPEVAGATEGSQFIEEERFFATLRMTKLEVVGFETDCN